MKTSLALALAKASRIEEETRAIQQTQTRRKMTMKEEFASIDRQIAAKIFRMERAIESGITRLVDRAERDLSALTSQRENLERCYRVSMPMK